jgi:hypothetical protein
MDETTTATVFPGDALTVKRFQKEVKRLNKDVVRQTSDIGPQTTDSNSKIRGKVHHQPPTTSHQQLLD